MHFRLLYELFIFFFLFKHQVWVLWWMLEKVWKRQCLEVFHWSFWLPAADSTDWESGLRCNYENIFAQFVLSPILIIIISVFQIFCLHGGLSPSLDTLDNIRALDRIQEVDIKFLARISCILFCCLSSLRKIVAFFLLAQSSFRTALCFPGLE